jgi:diacylglycerol O-acyltransferase / wax synthase
MTPASAWFERIGSGDLVQLATDVGPVPMNVGAALLLEPGTAATSGAVVAALGQRLATIPRLRQVLVDVPLGLGRPIWVDDPRFEVESHLEQVSCPEPGDLAALLGVATDAVVRPFDRACPLWRAVMITGLAGGRVGLVVAFHHALADGMGGLAVLARLVDDPTRPNPPIDPPPPRPRPTRRELLGDAMADRGRSVRRLPATASQVWSARAELGTGRRPLAPRTSLNVPTGPRRRVHVVRTDLDRVQAVAHANGATVNDVLLAAITGALGAVLAHRGEEVPALFVSVPIAARPATTTADLGNRTGVMPVRVPLSDDRLPTRLARIAAVTRAQKSQERGASMAVVGPAFRAAAALGVFQWMIQRQRLVNTFLTNLIGPNRPVTVAGIPIRRIIPITITAGNVTVAFAVLSYAGELTISVITDPDATPDADLLLAALQGELVFPDVAASG